MLTIAQTQAQLCGCRSQRHSGIPLCIAVKSELQPNHPLTPAAGSGLQAGNSPSLQTGKLNTSSAPILATSFSNEFQVFSAKKFPGVIDSTDLSKAFAKQGIKIPIRKDTGGARGNERRDWGDGDD